MNKTGFPPLLIKGKEFNNNELSLNSNVSSQYISALLLIGSTLKNGLKKTRVKTVILSSGCFRVSARKTGTVIATSPIAERRMTRMFLDGLGIIFHLKTSSILRLRSVQATKTASTIPCTY